MINDLVKLTSKKTKKSFLIICIFLLISTIYALIIKDYVFTSFFTSLLILFSILFVSISSSSYSQYTKKFYALSNNNKYESIFTFDDNIFIKHGPISLTLEYSLIKKIYSTKNAYIFLINDNISFMINPNTFTLGTFQEFLPFIQIKCHL